jgi:hypothetical protein
MEFRVEATVNILVLFFCVVVVCDSYLYVYLYILYLYISIFFLLSGDGGQVIKSGHPGGMNISSQLITSIVNPPADLAWLMKGIQPHNRPVPGGT